MKKIYIFDMDGTLTPSRREMTPDFENFFSKWANEHTFCCSNERRARKN